MQEQWRIGAKPWVRTGLVMLTMAGMLTGGCEGPLARQERVELDQLIVEASRARLKALEEDQTVEVIEPASELYDELTPERLEQLDEMSGPLVYQTTEVSMGPSLDGLPSETVALPLQRAVELAVRHNLDVSFAQIVPAISEAEIVRAEAAFDTVLFTNLNWQNVEQPQAQSVISGILVGTPVQLQEVAQWQTGVRKRLETGGQVSFSTGIDYVNSQTPAVNLDPDPSYSSQATLAINQPLLRNAGTGVNRAEIYLNRNAHRRDVLDLHAQLLNTLGDVEVTYWNLVFSRHRLAILQRLLDRTIQTRNELRGRRQFDVSPVQLAQAYSFVELRQGDVLQAQENVRQLSDELKQLLNAPDLPVASEALILPSNEPAEMPVKFNLLDAVTTALRHRPEVRRAILNIDDAAIRQMVADNQRLPLLSLNAQMQYFGLGQNVGDSYESLSEADFISYLIGGEFEVPFGNRLAEADYLRTRLARKAAVNRYMSATQQVVLSVKQSLRNLRTAYELIAVSRAARRAAADNLRALEERERTGEALTPEFLLDLKLNTQQRLADAEIRELQAIVDYNISLVRLHQATGTLLERNNIDMVWPDDVFRVAD